MEYINERVITEQIEAEPVKLSVVQAYMLTADRNDKEVEKVYASKEGEMKREKGKYIVMGDWNAVIGKGRKGNIVGDFGIGKRNERGKRLLQFYKDSKMIVGNTWFFSNHCVDCIHGKHRAIDLCGR